MSNLRSVLSLTMVDVKLVMNVFCLGTAQIRPSGIINTASDATEETPSSSIDLRSLMYRIVLNLKKSKQNFDSFCCSRVFIQTSPGYPGVTVWLVNVGEQLLPTTEDTKI